MIYCGQGATHIKNFMATLNVPSPCHKTMKKKERETGVEIENLAKESCEKAVLEERFRTEKRKSLELDDGHPVAKRPCSEPPMSGSTTDGCCVCNKSVPETLRVCRKCNCQFHHMCVDDEFGKLCNNCLPVDSSGQPPRLSTELPGSFKRAMPDEHVNNSEAAKHKSLELDDCQPVAKRPHTEPAQPSNFTADVCCVCKKNVPTILRVCCVCSRHFHMCVADEYGKVCNDCLGCGSSQVCGDGVAKSAATGLAVSFDMGWSKRGKGHNSLEGVGHMMGLETGQVLYYNTRNKRCAICERAERNNEVAPPHDCRRNWYGSSKAMESDVAVELATTAKEGDSGVKISVVIGDEDSSAIARLHREVDDTIEKWSDVVHVKRSLGSRLYDIKKKHKELTDKNIT